MSLKEVWWKTHENAINPDIYSKLHLVENGEEGVCLCNADIGLRAEFNDFKKGVDGVLEREIEGRKLLSGTDGKGLYCLKCLKKYKKEVDGGLR